MQGILQGVRGRSFDLAQWAAGASAVGGAASVWAF